MNEGRQAVGSIHESSLQSIYYVTDIVPVVGDTSIDKTNGVPALMERPL